MAAVLTFDIDALITAAGKGNGDPLVASDIGFSKLYKGTAASLNGSLAIKNDGTNNLEWLVEANGDIYEGSNSRTETYYAIRGTATVVKSGTPTPVVNDSFVRHSSASSDPRTKINLGDDYLAFSQQHGGGNSYQWAATTSSTTGKVIPYGTAFEYVWLFKRDGTTAANQFIGFYVNGNLVCAADGLATASDTPFSYSVRMWKWTHTAGLDFYLHGTLEVFSQNDPTGIVRVPTGSALLPVRVLPPTSGVDQPGLTETPTGVTYGYEPQSVGSGIDTGESTRTISGGVGDSDVAVYKPDTAPAFGSDGSLTVTAHTIAISSSNSVVIDLQDATSTNICSVRIIDDTTLGDILQTRIGSGSWSTLASSGVNVTHYHTIRFIQTSDGKVSVIVKDENAPSVGGGNIWHTILSTGMTNPARQVSIVNPTMKAATSTAKRGSVWFDNRPTFDFYTDSWTAGTSTNPPPIQVSNHFPRQIRGSRVGERIPGIAREAIGSTGYTISGAVCFGTSGVSINEWVTAVGPGLAASVRNQTVLMGVSYMNTVIEEASSINGSGYSATLNTTRDQYVAAANTLLANKNTVVFVGGTPPPVGANYTQAQHDFVVDLNAAIRTRLGQLLQPSGSALIWCDPFTAMGTTIYNSLTWDGTDTHLGTDTDDAIVRDWAWSSAGLITPAGGGRNTMKRLLLMGR